MYSLMKLFLYLALFFGGIMCSNQPKKTPRLFVFGDSYADAGNLEPDGESWRPPYGITFPGKPSGRYSDGLTSTDFLAKMLGVKSPNLWRTHGKKKNGLERGMNFAFGESGLFKDPADPRPDLTEQIYLLTGLLSPLDVETIQEIYPNDVSFISYAGKEYFDFMNDNRPVAEIKPFVDKVMDSLDTRLILMGGLQFKKIAITTVPPIGCLPYFSSTTSPFRCNETYSEMAKLHNNSLRKVVATLNENSVRKKKGLHYFIIDYHKAFMTILNNKAKFKNPFKTCCKGICGLVHLNGTKMYTLCDAPKSSFFWDSVHPSQEGWRSIFSVLGNPFSKA